MRTKQPEERRGLEALDGRPEEDNGGDRGKLFEELVFPVLDDLYAFACRLELDPSRAADLLQDALLRAFRNFSQLDRSASFRPWMAAILRRTFLNRHRRSELMVPLDEAEGAELDGVEIPPPAAPGSAPDERLTARRLSRELKTALDELPEEQRLAVFLVDAQGFTYEEAAGALHIPPGTVASRVARGRTKLRARLRRLASERGWT